MNRLLLCCVTAALVAPACGKRTPKTDIGPATTAEMWKLAPANAEAGIVAGPGALERLASTTAEIGEIMNILPAGKKLMDMARSRVRGPGELDPFNIDWKAWGINPAGGAGFFSNGQGDVVLAVLPVVDRTAFAKAIGATSVQEGGLAFDLVHGKLYCAPRGPAYICTNDAKGPVDLAPKLLSPLAVRGVGLADDIRGDIEVIVKPKETAGVPTLFGNVGIIDSASALELGVRIRGGKFVLTGRIEGKPHAALAAALAAIGTTPKLREISKNSSAVTHLRIPITLPAFQSEFPVGQQLPPPFSVDLRKDIIDQFTGELSIFAGDKGPLSATFAFGMRNTQTLGRIIKTGCGLVGFAVPALSMSSTNNGCTGTLDLDKLTQGQIPFKVGKIAVAVAFDADKLLLTLESKPSPGPINKASSDTMASFTAEGWDLSGWTILNDPQSTPLGHNLDSLMARALAKIGEQADGAPQVVRLLFAHLFDMGAGVALRPDGIHFSWAVTTMAADSDDAYKAFRTAATKLATGDLTGYQTDIATIAAAQPSSLVARKRNAPGIIPAMVMAGVWFMAGAYAPAAEQPGPPPPPSLEVPPSAR